MREFCTSGSVGGGPRVLPGRPERPASLGHSRFLSTRPEALFRTLKYRPNFPSRPFADIDAALTWVTRFVEWYNTQHLHCAINFVTPDDRHFGRHLKILSARSRVYEAARQRHPERWSGNTRNWHPVRVVCLNPEYDNGSSKSKAKHA